MPTKMCQQAHRLNQNKPNKTTLDDEFDIVESDADTISSDENSENSEIDKFDTVKDISEKAKEERRIQERLKKIQETQIGIKEFLQCLDYHMLGVFFKTIFAYIFCASILCIIYLVFIYNFNKAMWHEYFPVEDLSADIKDEL